MSEGTPAKTIYRKEATRQSVSRWSPNILSRFAMLFYCLTFGGFTWVWLFVCRLLYHSPYYTAPIVLLYMSYIYFIDRDAMFTGSWKPRWKTHGVWRYMKSYFHSATLVKTEDLDDGPYLFVFHPHGILAIGSWLAFGTNALNFREIFPNIRDNRLVTLNINFWAPVLREFLLLHGVCSCAKHSIIRLLRLKKSVTLVVGGGSESLLSHPNSYELVLNRRRGFIKVALETGTSIVPVISLGETNTYRTVNQFAHDNWIRKMQRKIERTLGFTIPIVLGKGVFLPYGLLPNHTVDLRVVTGKPLRVPQVDPKSMSKESFDELVDIYHQKYTNALLGLFDTEYKSYCREMMITDTPRAKMTIVE